MAGVLLCRHRPGAGAHAMSYTVSNRLEVRINNGTFTLLWAVECRDDESKLLFKVPKVFVTDFASIPRVFRCFAPKHGPGLRRAAVVHDYLYRTPGLGYSRAQADTIYRELMRVTGASPIRRENRYWMVRLFGGRSYNGGA